MFHKILKKIYFMNTESEEIKIIYLYRYLSWFCTSIFYLIGEQFSPLRFKLGVVVSLYIVSKIITDLYVKNSENIGSMKTLLLAETIGIAFLLIPTGGLQSPFIWYALNPVLVAASFLQGYFCWFHLIFYLLFSTGISFFIFNKRNNNLMEILASNSDLILIFILITIVVQLLSKLNHQLQNEGMKLKKTNRELIEANEKIKESMDHIMALYQTVEAFTTQDSKEKLIKTFAYYTKKITKASLSFFWMHPSEEEQYFVELCGDMMGDIESHIIEKGITIWKDRISHKNFIKEMDINGEKFMIISVRSILKNYGLIGITIKPNEKKINQQYIEQLNFISELSAMILDRFYLEQMSDSLIIAEEQNRIANEIHDSVSQRLFSISCAIHEVMKKSKKISIEQLQEKLMCIQDAANISIKELRRTIYGLSYRKSGEGIFQLDIEKLLKDVAKLNNVDINFKMSGNEEHLSSPLKKALYRIVSEATGNAIRHGKCSRLDIHLNIDNTMTNLFIKDDGEGFILQNVYQQKDTGLGITNMKHLVESFNGRILIDSTLKKGTTIEITIPNNKVNKIQEGGMAI